MVTELDPTGQSPFGGWGNGRCHPQQIGVEARECAAAPAIDRAGTAGKTPAVKLAGTQHHGVAGQQTAGLEKGVVHCTAGYSAARHRDLFRLVWRRKSRPKQQDGRPPLPGRVVQLIRRMARENPLWGAERIRGEMLKQNMSVAKSSVQKYTQDLRRVAHQAKTGRPFSATTHQRSGLAIYCKRMMHSSAVSLCS
jgi:hypothetical protein